MIAYYLLSALVALAVTSDLVTLFLPSLTTCLCYVFATTRVAMLISSVMKKSVTSAIVTFVTILLLITAVSAIVSTAGFDTWFVPNRAARSITMSIPEYVESSNGLLIRIDSQLGMDMSDFMIQSANHVRSRYVMTAWDLAILVLACLRFSRREF